jgi:hypothetical protein
MSQKEEFGGRRYYSDLRDDLDLRNRKILGV